MCGTGIGRGVKESATGNVPRGREVVNRQWSPVVGNLWGVGMRVVSIRPMLYDRGEYAEIPTSPRLP